MIRFIEDRQEKMKISREVLEALTQWFEVEESREQYIRESADQPFWAAFDNDVPAGFLCLKQTGREEGIPQKRIRQKAFCCGKGLCGSEGLFIHAGKDCQVRHVRGLRHHE